MDKTTTSGPVEGNGEIGNDASSSQNPKTCRHQSLPSTSQATEKTMCARKNYKRAANRGRKGSQVIAGRKNSLRSSHRNVRVLRFMSTAKNSPSESVHTPVQPAAKRTTRGKPAKSPKNEFSKIRQRVRYILNRMNYEQSLIEAYASEGWKRQSLEKIRPEKELERAKAEILRCKLRIREAFQNLDYLLSEGKLEESLFDSEGEISSEDIFCATCGSKDVTLSNDIILCDGVCDRGFHQNCLNPPLLTEDIPAGDEGWLCPACDCKIDCIDVINELQGTNLSISDSWEKVFPEAVAFANGPKQNDVSDLPSDDSEDNDFDPNMAEECVASASQVEGSSEEDEDEGSDSDDSNFVTSSDNSEPLKDKEKVDYLGLPSEDSEDDDYDPAGPDSDKDTQKKQSSSDESDFTSDSDDLCAEIAKSCGQDEVSSGSKAGDPTNDLEGTTVRANTENSNITSKDIVMDQDVVLPVSGRREVQRLDYKKLYDEAYGGASSDSSDGEEWSGKSTPEKDNEEQSETDSFARKSSRRTGAVHQSDELIPQSARQSLHPDALHGSASWQHAGELTSNGSNSTSQKRHFGPIINQRLREHFKIDQYPSRAVKESLAQELGLTFHQVSKWFASTRHYTRVATKKGTHLENHSTKRNRSSVVASVQVTDPKETMMEKRNVCKNDVRNEEMTSRNPNEVLKKDSSVKQDINGGQRMLVTPQESSQNYTTTLGLVGCSKGGSRDNHCENTSSKDVGRPKDNSAEDQNLGLELDEGRKKAILRELKRRKMSR